ncbi:PREDICTED: extended synaptotagmin-3-like [Calidris pugnax]|uniref:extended synaptotagmin-3-like n=1 Tax=Calidris pugnax TaxID=198806 RepID=UPI00071DAB44|nr:PREDICTED: extended synaptotagmin-3-like [Calidris pugnax]
MGGLVEGKSDPYAVLRVGTQVFTSRVIDNNLNPTWDEVYEVIVDNVPGQDVEFDLFDKDIDKDDFLGRCKVPLRRVLSSRIVDEGGERAPPPSPPPRSCTTTASCSRPVVRSSRPLSSPSSWTEPPTSRSGRAPSLLLPSSPWSYMTTPSRPRPAPRPQSPCGTKASPSSSSGRTWSRWSCR